MGFKRIFDTHPDLQELHVVKYHGGRISLPFIDKGTADRQIELIEKNGGEATYQIMKRDESEKIDKAHKDKYETDEKEKAAAKEKKLKDNRDAVQVERLELKKKKSNHQIEK